MRLRPLLVLALVLHFGSGIGAADQITLVADLDNTIFSESENSGGLATTVFAGQNNAGNVRRALLHFDVAGHLPANASISSAVLKLTLDGAAQTETADRVVALHRVTAAWGEGTSGGGGPGSGQGQPATPGDAAWVNRIHPGQPWTTAGGDFAGASSSTATVGTTLGDYLWASTPSLVGDVQGWAQNPSNNFGWILVGAEGTNGTIRRFFSREAAAGQRPTLTIDYSVVPEPTTIALFAAGAIALLAHRRRTTAFRAHG